MIRYLIVCLAILLFAWSVGATAQSQSCVAPVVCGGYSFNSGCLPILPKTAYACGTIAPFEAQCSVNTTACAPPPSDCSKTSCGAPINLADGNTSIAETDLKAPGLGGGLTLVRTWNSVWPARMIGSTGGMFGPNWTSNFEESVFVGSDEYMKYARSNGGFWSFGWTGQTDNTNTYALAGPQTRQQSLSRPRVTGHLHFRTANRECSMGQAVGCFLSQIAMGTLPN